MSLFPLFLWIWMQPARCKKDIKVISLPETVKAFLLFPLVIKPFDVILHQISTKPSTHGTAKE